MFCHACEPAFLQCCLLILKLRNRICLFLSFCLEFCAPFSLHTSLFQSGPVFCLLFDYWLSYITFSFFFWNSQFACPVRSSWICPAHHCFFCAHAFSVFSYILGNCIPICPSRPHTQTHTAAGRGPCTAVGKTVC